MTQQAISVVMSATEFDDSHYRTGQYLARIGKLWEPIAEEQQAIIDGKGYTHMNYDSWVQYWDAEWKETSGWSANNIAAWMQARNAKLSTPLRAGSQWDNLGPAHWRELGKIEPEQRGEFLERYEEDIKPKLKAEGVSSQIFREGVKEFKGERQPTVREVVPPEEMAKLPSPDLSESENWVFQPGKTQMALRRLDPDAVADDAYRLLGPKVDNEVETINYIIDWYASYRQAILSRKNTGLRAVQ